jgi:hypothetical protein
MNSQEPQPQAAPTIIGVSAAVPFGEANVVITGDDAATLREFLTEKGITGFSEIRQTITALGPVVELASILHIKEMAAGLTAAQCFALTHGDRTIGNEVTKEECEEAKSLGLVIVFGYSDDVTAFNGAIRDEAGYGELFITQKGKILDGDAIEALEGLIEDGTIENAPAMGKIVSDYSKEGVWTFTTDIPHATFDVTEDGQLYCRAIVFHISDLIS